VIKTGAETTVTYTPSRLLAPASRHTATLLFQDGANPVSRAWQFTVGAYTQDKVRSYVGTLQGNATYTADAGGHSGKPSDYAIDFGRVGDGSVYIKHAGQFLNVASTNDEMSFSLWIKRYDIADSSTFWANAPSVGGSRGWQAHTPWSDETIYFDTAGCCDTSAQRISDTITNFTGYTGNDGFWTNWHHFVLSKKLDDKQIWIDGQQFLDGSSSNPLPTDFTDMYLGSYGTGGGGFMHGLIDDFAVFATALGANDITMLFSGAAPTALATRTKLLAYWDFNDAPVPVVSIPSIGIALVSGKPTITYTGTLQSSLTVNGTFTDVTGATNPYTPTATGPQTFYRARQ